MNTLDIIILVPLVYFAFKGFTKGFIITLAMFVGILIGIYAAIHFSEFSIPFLQETLHFHSGNIPMISYLFTFIIVLVLVYLLGQFLTRVVKTTGLGFINRLGGLLLGIVKGLVIISVFVVILSKIDPHSSLISVKSKEESALYKPVLAISLWAFPIMEKYTDKAKSMIIGDEKKQD